MSDHHHGETPTPGPALRGGPGERGKALGLPRLLSDVQAHEQIIARVDGVLNLLTKALRAKDAGDRTAALALVERAERFAPEDPDQLPPEHREGFAAIQEALRVARQEALALPEPPD